MSAADLISELNESFQDEPYPGELNIVYNNSGSDLEVQRIWDTFKVHTWQTLPDELMQYEQGGYIFLSKKGLKYYLPAYLRFAVRDYSEADSIPGSLVFSLTLPTETDEVLSALNTKRYRMDRSMPTIDWNEYHQNRLRGMDERVHSFINDYGQFNRAQSRAILHFLEHMRDEYGDDFFHNEPEVAIQRYWFQFA